MALLQVFLILCLDSKEHISSEVVNDNVDMSEYLKVKVNFSLDEVRCGILCDVRCHLFCLLVQLTFGTR